MYNKKDRDNNYTQNLKDFIENEYGLVILEISKAKKDFLVKHGK